MSLRVPVYAAVLAGGKGTRLNPLTGPDMAKPVLTLAGVTNTLSLVLSSLSGAGIDTIDIYTQYARQSINDYVECCWRTHFNSISAGALNIVPPGKKMTYQGTADAVLHNIDRIKDINPEHVIIAPADHVCWFDYRHFLHFHHSRGAKMSIAVIPVAKHEAARRLGVLTVDKRHRIIDFSEKPTDPVSMPGHEGMALSSMGIYLFETNFLLNMLQRFNDECIACHDFGHDIIPRLVAEKADLFAYYFADEHKEARYWQDVGTIQSYHRTHIADLLGLNPKFSPFINPYTHQQIPVNSEFLALPVGFYNAAMMQDSLIGAGCHLEGCTIERSVISPNVTVGRDVHLHDTIVHADAVIEHGSRLENVIMARGANVPPNSIITPMEIRTDFKGTIHREHNIIVLA